MRVIFTIFSEGYSTTVDDFSYNSCQLVTNYEIKDCVEILLKSVYSKKTKTKPYKMGWFCRYCGIMAQLLPHWISLKTLSKGRVCYLY